MDAKAKVVAWRYRRDGATKWAYTDIPLEAGAALGSMEHETQELTTLTDHEAALAAVVAEREGWKRSAEKQVERVVDLMAQQDRLLTGLEALAGEMREDMEAFKGGVEGSWYRWRYDTFSVMEERIRTLASSVTGEKNTEEETKL